MTLPLSGHLGSDRDGPWEMVVTFTVRGDDADEADARVSKLLAAARRLGITDHHSDYEGPDVAAPVTGKGPS